MDLKYYFECIFSLVLFIWQGKNVFSMECEVGLLLQKPGVNVQCCSLSDNDHPIKENCQYLSCRQKETVDWSIINVEKGELRVRYRALPENCDFETYLIELEIYDEKIPYDEALMCNTGNTSWMTHSKRVFDKRFCSLDLSGGCLLEHVAHFSYVYAGFYRLKITPYVNGSTRQAQRSYRLHINNTVTHYVKKQFSGLHLNASLQYRSSSQELDLGIPLLIDDPPDAIKIEVKFSFDYIDLYGIIIHGNENSTNIQCESNKKSLWPSCQINKAGLACKFYNMTHGFYTVFVSFTDDRCMRGTVWAGNHTDPCFWVIKKEFAADQIIDSYKPNVENATSQVLFICVVILVIVGVIATSLIAKKFNTRRKELPNSLVGKIVENPSEVETEQTYNFSNNYNSRFNFGQIISLSDRLRPEVLLIYARETRSFMELVASFRRVLSRIFQCQVYDYFDSDLWNEISKDPKGWVRTLIIERQIKLIIIASEIAAIQYRSLIDEFSEHYYKSPHPFDHLYLYAIRLIRDIMDEESYKNLFVITFEGITESNHLIEYFNPYTRFTLPNHLYKLLEHLCDSETYKEVDVKEFEETFEIRQFKSQLNHLLNLKLVGDKEVEVRKMFI